jgi:hypothetical protein
LGHWLRDRIGLLEDDIHPLLVVQLAKFVAGGNYFDEMEVMERAAKVPREICACCAKNTQAPQ